MAIEHVIHEEVLGCETIAFDEHAVERMNERKVTVDKVVEVLKHPDETGLPADLSRERYRKIFADGVRIDVVFERDPTQIVVITVVQRKGR